MKFNAKRAIAALLTGSICMALAACASSGDREGKLSPNRETMPQLTLPVYIFQGTIDANVPVEQSREIADTFQTEGKSNLHLLEFEMHDHDLNYILYPLSGTISEGIQAIFDTAKGL